GLRIAAKPAAPASQLEAARRGRPERAQGARAAELGGELADLPGALLGPRGRGDDAGLVRGRQDPREARGLVGAELARGPAEVEPARRADAEDAGAELREVQVDLEDAPLRPQRLDPQREPRLEALAHPAAARPEEEVLRDLLRDRARAAQAPRVLV